MAAGWAGAINEIEYRGDCGVVRGFGEAFQRPLHGERERCGGSVAETCGDCG